MKRTYKKVSEVGIDWNTIFTGTNLFVDIGFTSDDIFLYFLHKYSEYRYRYETDFETSNLITGLNKLHSYNIGKMVSALTSEYKVLDNYNMTEQSEKIIAGELSYSGKSSTTSETTTTDNTENTEKVSPYDSETFNNNKSNNINNTGSANGTTSTNNTNTTENNATEKNTLSRSGNIGVTTSQQMLQSELDLRKFNIIDYYLNIIARYILLSYIY